MPYLKEELIKIGFSYSTIYVEEYQEIFPDCNLLIDNKMVKTEFELNSSNFKEHGHNPEQCDLLICWYNDWLNCPIPVLELSKVLKSLKANKHFVLNNKPKYPDRGVKRWELDEFKLRLKDTVLAQFVETLLANDSLFFETGKGKKVVTLGIGVDGKNYPLVIEETGKAYFAYYNVNIKPPVPLLSDGKIKKIRDFLSESSKLPKPRQWHYIKTTNTIQLIEKLKTIIEILGQKEE